MESFPLRLVLVLPGWLSLVFAKVPNKIEQTRTAGLAGTSAKERVEDYYKTELKRSDDLWNIPQIELAFSK